MIATILIGLLKANLAAGVAVLLVLAVRGLVRRRFGARAAYALWLAPLAAAAAVLAPHPQIATPMSPIILGAESAADAFVAQAPQAARNAGPDIVSLLFAAWLAGTLGTAALVLRRQARFSSAMGRLTPTGAPGVFRAESLEAGPAVVGVFRPRIVAPADFETRFAPAERALILAHERAHLASGDAAINALACAVRCLSWFSPLAHLAVRLLRVDQELACDAAVVGRFPAARRAYAELLLKTQIVTQPLPLGCHWPAGSEHPLKERIAMLKSPLPEPSMRRMGAAVALSLALGAGGLAWAAEPTRPEPATPALPPTDAAEPIPAVAPTPPAPIRAARKALSPAPLRTPISFAASEDAAPPVTDGSKPTGESATAAFLAVPSPNWSRRPEAEDLMRAYPADAAKGRLEGDVVLHCHVTLTGQLTDCSVLRETPQGAGFGAAALKLTELFEAREQTPEGGPKRGSDIRIPIRFRMPSAPAPSAN
ncbi:MAG TPA: TonB family protein [Phenylobacterium sp.]|jgi:TonB family protein|uniref:TonB family protein n=1 Tax=Phenylobacterium sp. TaxID=1871053 RepID=UPI002D3D9D85|nr:TonB family protein [Phenylobacterium sp.]HZZ67469.1 TonB family protein [Phenylobacterium sp.]